MPTLPVTWMSPYPLNSQLPRGERSTTVSGEKRKAEEDDDDDEDDDTRKEKKSRKVDHGLGYGGVNSERVPASGSDVLDRVRGQKAARTYQAWLEARYVDFLKALLGWVTEVDDFRLQVPHKQRAPPNFPYQHPLNPRWKHRPRWPVVPLIYLRGSPLIWSIFLFPLSLPSKV